MTKANSSDSTNPLDSAAHVASDSHLVPEVSTDGTSASPQHQLPLPAIQVAEAPGPAATPAIPVLDYDDGNHFLHLRITEPAPGELKITEPPLRWMRYGPTAVLGILTGLGILAGGIAFIVHTQVMAMGIILIVAACLLIFASCLSLRRGGRIHYIHLSAGKVYYLGDGLWGRVASRCARHKVRDVYAQSQFSLVRPSGVLILQTPIMRWSLFRGAPWLEVEAVAKLIRERLGLPEDKRSQV